MTMAPLRGLCWDHPRSFGPLDATSSMFDVTWDRRSLDRFNDEPLEEVMADYDLIVIDHPFVGRAAETGLLIPIDDLLDESLIARARTDSVGQGSDAYLSGGKLWALDIDSACHVSLRARNRLEEGATPRTWSEVLTLARQRPGRVGVPLAAADAWCVVLSIGSLIGAPVTTDDLGSIGDAFEMLRELASVVHPDSFRWNPPTLMREMAQGHIDYAPLLFGYAIAARDDMNLAFEEAPFFGDSQGGPLLGGSGIAITAGSRHRDDAAMYLEALATAEVQRTVLAAAGGQPPSSRVWRDKQVDSAAGGFFSHTIGSLERAYRRPTDSWWPGFQLRASRILHAALSGDLDRTQLEAALRSTREREISA